MTVKGSVLKQMEDLKEETGLTCCICREGYRNEPTKVFSMLQYVLLILLSNGRMRIYSDIHVYCNAFVGLLTVFTRMMLCYHGVCCGPVSVCSSVHHKSVLYQNG